MASYDDDGLQIINITDPANPGAVAALFDSTPGNYTGYAELDGARSVTVAQIGTSHYALVASVDDDGLQIINMTDPQNPSQVAALFDSTAENPTAYTELDGAYSIATARIGTNHYALVASYWDDGLQIIDITDPANPGAVAAVTDSTAENPTGYAGLEGAAAVAAARIGDKHYALVTSFWDNSLQIIDITDPANPSAVAAVTDGEVYTTLYAATAVAATQIGDRHYALVVSTQENGLQVIDITDPVGPPAAAAVTDATAYPELDGATSVAVARIGDGHYALVAPRTTTTASR